MIDHILKHLPFVLSVYVIRQDLNSTCIVSVILLGSSLSLTENIVLISFNKYILVICVPRRDLFVH